MVIFRSLNLGDLSCFPGEELVNRGEDLSRSYLRSCLVLIEESFFFVLIS